MRSPVIKRRSSMSVTFSLGISSHRKNVTLDCVIAVLLYSSQLLQIRWNRIVIPQHESVKPVKLPVQALDQMFWLAGAGKVMVLARKHHDFRRHTKVLESAKPLLALLQRHAKVVVGM